MITFISNWFIQINPIRADPVIEIEMIRFVRYLLVINGVTRIKPYPPNFNKIEAKIIDPTTGASTWAFGSHKCPRKIGSLIKKASINLMAII